MVGWLCPEGPGRGTWRGSLAASQSRGDPRRFCKDPHDSGGGGLFSGLCHESTECCALQRQELDCVLPMGKADGGQTSRSTVKSELKSLFPSHSSRGTPRGPGTSLTGVRGLQEGCPPGAQLLS